MARRTNRRLRLQVRVRKQRNKKSTLIVGVNGHDKADGFDTSEARMKYIVSAQLDTGSTEHHEKAISSHRRENSLSHKSIISAETTVDKVLKSTCPSALRTKSVYCSRSTLQRILRESIRQMPNQPTLQFEIHAQHQGALLHDLISDITSTRRFQTLLREKKYRNDNFRSTCNFDTKVLGSA